MILKPSLLAKKLAFFLRGFSFIISSSTLILPKANAGRLSVMRLIQSKCDGRSGTPRLTFVKSDAIIDAKKIAKTSPMFEERR